MTAGRLALSTGIGAGALLLVLRTPAWVGINWASATAAFGELSGLTLAALSLLWIAGLACNSIALAASLPGLTTWRALKLSLSGSAVANMLPLGGAAGVGLNYAMTRSWGFSRRSFAAYTVTTNMCAVASKLVVVAAASAILLINGAAALLPVGATTVLGLLILLPALACLLLHHSTAVRVGRLLDQVVVAGARRTERRVQTHLEQVIPRVGRMTVELLKQRWGRLAVGTVSYSALQAVLLWGCMQAAGLDLNTTSLAAALAVDRVLTLLPLTPGGLGVVEGGMAAVLVALGSAAGPAVAGVLLYRAFTYLAEIPVGGLTALTWTLRSMRAAKSSTCQGKG